MADRQCMSSRRDRSTKEIRLDCLALPLTLPWPRISTSTVCVLMEIMLPSVARPTPWPPSVNLMNHAEKKTGMYAVSHLLAGCDTGCGSTVELTAHSILATLDSVRQLVVVQDLGAPGERHGFRRLIEG